MLEEIIINGKPMRGQREAMINNRSGVKLTIEDARIFARLSWLNFGQRPSIEQCDAARFVRRSDAYVLTLNL